MLYSKLVQIWRINCFRISAIFGHNSLHSLDHDLSFKGLIVIDIVNISLQSMSYVPTNKAKSHIFSENIILTHRYRCGIFDKNVAHFIKLYYVYRWRY